MAIIDIALRLTIIGWSTQCVMVSQVQTSRMSRSAVRDLESANQTLQLLDGHFLYACPIPSLTKHARFRFCLMFLSELPCLFNCIFLSSVSCCVFGFALPAEVNVVV